MATSEVMIYHVNRQVDLIWKNVTLSLEKEEKENNLDINAHCSILYRFHIPLCICEAT